MMAITPIGTPVFSITMPLGRSTREITRPTGSGSSATWRTPSAMPATRSGVRRRRSSITSEIWPFAVSMSSALAARISSCEAISCSAMAFNAAFFVCESAALSFGQAARAAFMISNVVMPLPSQ